MPDRPDIFEALMLGERAGADPESQEILGIQRGLAARPGASLRARLIESCANQSLEGFVDRVAAFLDLPEDDARRALEASRSDPAQWPQQPAPGLSIRPVALGPRHGDAQGMILCLAPGAEIPRHGHRGDEWGFILFGRFADDLGDRKTAGDLVHHTSQDVHRVWNAGDEPAIAFNIINNGYDWTP